MAATRAEQMAQEIVEVADQVRSAIDNRQESADLYQDLKRLRRSAATLERELRDDSESAQGDAC